MTVFYINQFNFGDILRPHRKIFEFQTIKGTNLSIFTFMNKDCI